MKSRAAASTTFRCKVRCKEGIASGGWHLREVKPLVPSLTGAGSHGFSRRSSRSLACSTEGSLYLESEIEVVHAYHGENCMFLPTSLKQPQSCHRSYIWCSCMLTIESPARDCLELRRSDGDGTHAISHRRKCVHSCCGDCYGQSPVFVRQMAIIPTPTASE